MIRRAVLNEIDDIMKIIRDTIEIMGGENNCQWDENYPARQDFIDDIESGTLYVCEEEGAMCGLICVNETEPYEYAALPWSRKERAMVIHRMAVAPGLRRRGAGKRLMLYAEELARERGIVYLKTDTYSNNDKMNHLIQSLGYQKIGDMHFKGKPELFPCYEKVAATSEL